MATLPPITVFDLETTGLDPKRGHRVVEIAGVRIENGIVTDKTFTSLVNPERDIPFETKQIHGISNEDVANAPTMMAVLPQFLEFAAGTTWMAHNAAFDKGFLESEKEFCWGYMEIPEPLCSMKLSQSLFPTAFRHSLDFLSEKFQMPLPQGRHRALPDVLQTAQIILKMIEVGKISSMGELKQKASLNNVVSFGRR